MLGGVEGGVVATIPRTGGNLLRKIVRAKGKGCLKTGKKFVD